LVGHWRLANGEIVVDATCKRIARLIEYQLTTLGTDPTGWDTLFRDPADGRYWELIYPESDSDGGGPPRLTCIDEIDAKRKYGF
jgi:hypothetical protein